MRFLTHLSVLLALLLAACAVPLKVEDVSFKLPESLPGHQEIEGLTIAAVPISSLERSKEIFNTDLKVAGVLPVHLIVHNKGTKEFEINHQQIFGITADGTYQVAFTLGTTASKIRTSSIGTTVAAQAAAGAIVGAAVGVGIGAGIGSAGGSTSEGATAGAIIGGTTGTAVGAAEGASDSWTLEFKKQLTVHAFEDRVVYPGDIQQGFIYLRWKLYDNLRIKLFDITDNKVQEIILPIHVQERE